MHSYALHLFLIIFISPTIPISADIILLNSGDPTTSTDTTGRTWDADNGSRYSPPDAAAISSSSAASFMDPSVFQVPYKTARVFRSPFTYTFPAAVAGPKFLRLYFYPNTYSHFDTSQSFFSLTANAFTLLTNFSAFLHSEGSGKRSFMKEFVMNVNTSLDLTFFPNPESFAFVNGIEIVSIPDNLYYGGTYYIKVDGSQLVHLESTTAMENLYRLNVGGAGIQDDGGGMFRFWSPDDDYIYFADYGWTVHREAVQIKYTADTPPYSAPAIVYSSGRVMSNYSMSLEWGFPVDSGFFYLLRLHFCEFMLEVNKPNQRVFTIKINEQIVEIEMDVIDFAGGPEIPIYRDYITWVPDVGRRHGKRDLRLSLVPFVEGQPVYFSALLNGLEIFRLSDSNRSLAELNPELVSEPPPAKTMPPWKSEKRRGGGHFLTYAATGGIAGVLAVAAMSFLIFRRWRKLKNTAATGKSWELLSSIGTRSTNTLPSDLCRYFSLDQMRVATGNFNGDLVVGTGGFGNVYKGFIDDGATTVAIKRLNRLSNQGLREFSTEIDMLSRLRHHNLVSLIGYCSDFGEMILVYEYMAHGTLRDHLRSSSVNPPLKWEQRLKICLGAARGLHHLHTGAGRAAVIHRDIKTTNILLDEKWAAKVSDFGLSKVGPLGGAEGHVSTAVKGSFGYVDPEYYKRRQLTEKSDVYSFGVVMLEVLCGRPAVDPSLPYEQANLAAWARLCYAEGTVEKIVDSNLDGQISPECFDRFAETAAACVREKGIERPAMSDVVWSLEFALQLQETSVESSECGSAIQVEISSTDV